MSQSLRLKVILPSALLLVLIGLIILVTAACGGDNGDSDGPSGPSLDPLTLKIAFVSERDGDRDIYLMNADGSQQVNLTQSTSTDQEPSWSPDGALLAFSSSRDDGFDIYSMRRDGSQPRRLTEERASEGRPRWSPDGRRIAFYTLSGSQRLWLMNADGGGAAPIKLPAGPSCQGGFPGGWSADGSLIVFRGSNGTTHALEICQVSPDGSAMKALVSQEDVFNFSPAVAPDGRIVYVSKRDGNSEIYLANADGSKQRRLTNDEGRDLNPVWSPDGQWIAFASERDGDFEIFIMRADGSDRQQLTKNGADDVEPAWAPS